MYSPVFTPDCCHIVYSSRNYDSCKDLMRDLIRRGYDVFIVSPGNLRVPFRVVIWT